MRMGKRNQELSYEMRVRELELKVSEEERDLGVIMHKSENRQGNVLKHQRRRIEL